ncbi:MULTISPECIES: type II toxin-antitoxin system YafQ family toxin [Oligella]|uniref:type II toxin-antitoxin system YafQ family toxin n=1 Tax=Oligella TaxID=90243 RepID=UPI0009DD7C6A|nr:MULTISPECIES: type II toxin-antitoxin system YafQ family toxin [Oligella]PMC14470.1 type II toxin-antitoxin system YafQ family toxin [Oligella urethralis]
MLALIPSNQFKRDAKKRWIDLLSEEWITVAHCLIHNQVIPDKHRDHSLVGDWSGFRECHIKPDLLLIYAKYERTIELVRIGSHSELFK